MIELKPLKSQKDPFILFVPHGLIITFILKVLFLSVDFFFFPSRDDKREVRVVLPNHSDGLQARGDICVTQLQASRFFSLLFGSGWLWCNLELSNQVYIHLF